MWSNRLQSPSGECGKFWRNWSNVFLDRQCWKGQQKETQRSEDLSLQETKSNRTNRAWHTTPTTIHCTPCQLLAGNLLKWCAQFTLSRNLLCSRISPKQMESSWMTKTVFAWGIVVRSGPVNFRNCCRESVHLVWNNRMHDNGYWLHLELDPFDKSKFVRAWISDCCPSERLKFCSHFGGISSSILGPARSFLLHKHLDTIFIGLWSDGKNSRTMTVSQE